MQRDRARLAGAPVPGADVGFVVTGANPRTARRRPTRTASRRSSTPARTPARTRSSPSPTSTATRCGTRASRGQATQTFAPLPGPQRTSVPDLEGATERRRSARSSRPTSRWGRSRGPRGASRDHADSDLAVARPERRRRQGTAGELPAREGAAELTLVRPTLVRLNRPQRHTMRGCTGRDRTFSSDSGAAIGLVSAFECLCFLSASQSSVREQFLT